MQKAKVERLSHHDVLNWVEGITYETVKGQLTWDIERGYDQIGAKDIAALN
jgi:hypothetical protein